MTNTISASSVSEPNATGSVNERLADLVKRAEDSALNAGTNKKNKALLGELSFAVVALAQRVTELQAQIEDKPRIVVP
jgi:hypothetical protein